jgi:hypothetical protein
MIPRPTAEDAASFYFTYIDKVPDGADVLAVLAGGPAATRAAVAGVTSERERHRYAEGKWSIREVLGHIVDTERVFGYRAFHMSRGDRTPLPSMDQDVYAAHAGADDRPLADLLDELEWTRRGHLAMFAGFDAAAWQRTGTASDRLFRVSAFPYILAGHEIHHRQILIERYFGG